MLIAGSAIARTRLLQIEFGLVSLRDRGFSGGRASQPAKQHPHGLSTNEALRGLQAIDPPKS
jgi:hypothetical protein